MSLADIHDADMARIIADAGNVFTWQDTEYACIISTLGTTKDLDEGGFMDGFDMTLSTRTSLFSAFLEVGDLVTVNEGTYRVVRVRKNFTGTILLLSLQTKEK